MTKKISLLKKFDWFTLSLYLLLVLGGWISICGASYEFDMAQLFAMGSRPMMQLLWIGTALLLGCAILLLEPDFIETFSPIFYVAMMLLLVLTIFIAPDIKGSRSWLVLGPVRLQPAEFAKVATAMVLAWRFNQYGFKLDSWQKYAQIMGIILLPMLLIIGQHETGSALVFAIFFFSLYREGFSGLFMGLGVSAIAYFVLTLICEGQVWMGTTPLENFLLPLVIYLFSLIAYQVYSPHRDKNRQVFFCALLAAVALSVGYFVHHYYPFNLSILSWLLSLGFVLWLLYLALKEYVLRYFIIACFALGSLGFFLSIGYVFNKVLEPHQQVRIKIALGIEEDIRGKGYNVDQSKIAIGSGGLWGKGFLEGTQTKLSYVPEQATDFIFCTVGEEEGFVGSVSLLVVYMIFILRIVALAERQSSIYARVYGYAVASIFLFHLFINVGMVMGLIPVIGIPLPFFSYGGSSMWGFTMLLFIFLRLDLNRT